MALTAKNMPYKHSFGPFAPEVYRAPMSYPFRDPAGSTGEQAAARRAIDLIEKQVGADNVACVVIEPIQGEGGFVVPGAGLPAGAGRRGARDTGVVFVADEIQTGFAAPATGSPATHEGVVPDLITTAKGIAGGLPLAAVTGRAEIMDAPHVGGLGGTYGGNPVACAAALGAIETMESHDLAGRSAVGSATVMTRRLRELAATLRRHRRRPRPRRDGRRRARPARHRSSPDAAVTGRGREGLPRRRAGRAHLRHLRQRAAASCRRLVMPDHLLDEGLGDPREGLRGSRPDRWSHADTVLVGGRVFVGGESRPGAVAVAGGRIVLVGSDDEVRAMVGPGHRRRRPRRRAGAAGVPGRARAPARGRRRHAALRPERRYVAAGHAGRGSRLRHRAPGRAVDARLRLVDEPTSPAGARPASCSTRWCRTGRPC